VLPYFKKQCGAFKGVDKHTKCFSKGSPFDYFNTITCNIRNVYLQQARNKDYYETHQNQSIRKQAPMFQFADIPDKNRWTD